MVKVTYLIAFLAVVLPMMPILYIVVVNCMLQVKIKRKAELKDKISTKDSKLK